MFDDVERLQKRVTALEGVNGYWGLCWAQECHARLSAERQLSSAKARLAELEAERAAMLETGQLQNEGLMVRDAENAALRLQVDRLREALGLFERFALVRDALFATASTGLLDAMRECLAAIVAAPEEAAAIMSRRGLKIEDLNDPMQKLAFSFYNMLVEQKERVRYNDHLAALVAPQAATDKGEQNK